MATKIIGRKVWLVTSESLNGKPEVMSILSIRKSAKYVADFIEQLYIHKYYSVDEKMGLALGTWDNPYRVSYAVHNSVPHKERMICGGNPWIEARIVRIKRWVGNDLEWEEIPHANTCGCWQFKALLK
jgi:hypothetical protein